MKTTIGALIEKIEEIESVIHQLEVMANEKSQYCDTETRCFENAALCLNDYKDILYHTKVEI